MIILFDLHNIREDEFIIMRGVSNSQNHIKLSFTIMVICWREIAAAISKLSGKWYWAHRTSPSR